MESESVEVLGGGEVGLVNSMGNRMEERPWYPTTIGELKFFIGL